MNGARAKQFDAAMPGRQEVHPRGAGPGSQPSAPARWACAASLCASSTGCRARRAGGEWGGGGGAQSAAPTALTMMDGDDDDFEVEEEARIVFDLQVHAHQLAPLNAFDCTRLAQKHMDSGDVPSISTVRVWIALQTPCLAHCDEVSGVENGCYLCTVMHMHENQVILTCNISLNASSSRQHIVPLSRFALRKAPDCFNAGKQGCPGSDCYPLRLVGSFFELPPKFL